MEAASLAFSVAQTLLTALQSSELKQLFSMWGYQSQLHNLEKTVKTIKSVLLSADSKQALTPQEWDFIDNLKEVVYEADELIDEFITTVSLKQQHQSSGKVQALFQRFEKLNFAYKTSQKIKKIRKKLDRVADDANKFCFKIDDLPIRKRREETCSYVNVNDIVGRDDDLEKIVHMLLDPNLSQEDVSVVTIVGMGGLGKTALAQLVYNDPRVKNDFPLRLWACVSDQDQTQFDVKPILASILKSTSTILDELVEQLREKLNENKYLLVLDDVWTENNGDWLKLKPYFSGLHHKGNNILVTTRSKGTAIAVGSSHTYELGGLSDEYSWRLFEMVAESERANCRDLVGIGKEIVKKCVNVPLAIKVIAGLLYGQEENTWQSFQKSRLSEIRKDENDIMSILEFSYRHLSLPLRSCFTYCALFAKDFVFDKEKLIHLWMAQDYVVPMYEAQNIEDAAQEYFQILVRRCFFQDLENNQFEEVARFKIHDLMHDMVQQVAGNEISVANLTTSTLGNKIRHLYDDAPYSRTQDFFVKAKIRTYLMKYGNDGSKFPVSTLLRNWRSLRTLDLSHMDLKSLPDTIGQLLHLRYLDLFRNTDLEKLPISLTKLINLQFLNLDRCYKLKELPKDLSKLVNLRTLYVPNSLESMPLDMTRMTRLTRLNRFIVNLCLKHEKLRALRNLKGSLSIYVKGNYKHAKEYCGKGDYICNAEHLNSIHIKWPYELTEDERFSSDEEGVLADDEEGILGNEEWVSGNDEEGVLDNDEEGRLGNDEEVLEDLQPHTNLKELMVERYTGVRMARWAREDSLTTSLPNLVKIQLWNCNGLKELPWLGRLQHLKTLSLYGLNNLKYMENRKGIGSSSNDGDMVSNSSILFFPSLEDLYLCCMPKLKGWWEGGMSNSGSEIVSSDSNMLTAPLPSFPRLCTLFIKYCGSMMSIPLCPAMKHLEFDNINVGFQVELEERYRHAIVPY